MELKGLLSEEQRGEGMGEELSGEGLNMRYWPSVRSRRLDIGQILFFLSF